MNKPYHIVFTTIYHPTVLNDLYDNISRHQNLDDVKIWVIGDNKTPDTCADLAASISKKGLETSYLNIATQDKWGKQCSDF